MSITASTRRAGPYATNGSTTTFAFAFKVFDTDDVRVVSYADSEETDLVETTDYTVTLNEDQDSSPGGTVTTTSALNGPTVTIISAVPIEQPVTFTNSGSFYPRVLNDALDRQTMISQQLDERVSRTLVFPVGEEIDTMPVAAERADTIFGFDSDGNRVLLPLAGASVALQAQRREFEATAGQTEFQFLAAALSGFVSVYLNGVRLSEDDFTVSGTTVTLTSGASRGDIVAIEGFVRGAGVLPTAAQVETGDGSTVQAKLTAIEAITGDQQPAIADHATDATVNAILVALRAHGLIAT